ncbi:hypothetical protein LCGC14_1835370, partial [marine sediment metagenome]
MMRSTMRHPKLRQLAELLAPHSDCPRWAMEPL